MDDTASGGTDDSQGGCCPDNRPRHTFYCQFHWSPRSQHCFSPSARERKHRGHGAARHMAENGAMAATYMWLKPQFSTCLLVAKSSA